MDFENHAQELKSQAANKLENLRSETPNTQTQHQVDENATLPNIWKECMGSMFSDLHQLNESYNTHLTEFQAFEDTTLQDLQKFVETSHNINANCQENLSGLHGSITSLASLFTNRNRSL